MSMIWKIILEILILWVCYALYMGMYVVKGDSNIA